MTRLFKAILFYVIAIPTIVFFQRRFQSDTGPGINIYAFVVIVVYAFWLLFNDLRVAVLRTTEPYTPVFVHLIGLAIITYLIFFDQILMLRR